MGAAPGANGSFEADVRSSAIMVPHPNTIVEELLASAARGPGRDRRGLVPQWARLTRLSTTVRKNAAEEGSS